MGKDSEYFNLLLDSPPANKAFRSVSASASAMNQDPANAQIGSGHSPASTVMTSSYLVGKAGTLKTQQTETTILPTGDTITRQVTNTEQINKQDSLNPPGGLKGGANDTSNYQPRVQNNNKNKKKSKSRSSKSLHLVILEFIKIFNVTNEEILYVDCTEAAVLNMQNINLCKTLKPHSHHAMQLQHHGKKKSSKQKRSDQRSSDDIESDDEENEEHWIMTQNIIDMIDSQVSANHTIDIENGAMM